MSCNVVSVPFPHEDDDKLSLEQRRFEAGLRFNSMLCGCPTGYPPGYAEKYLNVNASPSVKRCPPKIAEGAYFFNPFPQG